MGRIFNAARLHPAATLLYKEAFSEASMSRCILGAILLLIPRQDPLLPVDGLGLRVAPGFKVTLYSGPEIANDIYAMTLDTKGRVVVTSQGWIKVLHEDGQGRADRATVFAPTRTGGMGLCFDGNDLLFSGDNGLWRFRDPDGAGVALGPPEKLSTFVSGEHGHHAMRKGPDGWWYLIGGNEAKITRDHVTLPTSPVKSPETGAIVRYTPEFTRSEVIAHGFRNPYDFDWNAAGDLFTYDSDCERDHHLPWYTPTRVYHVGIGMNHGWRLKGHMRSFARRDYSIDTVDMLWPVGRGSPTGVTVYRHTQFPEHYRGGLFALDWTFGKVYFFPLNPKGASYTTEPELFLESTGSEGFAPTDVCVAPDGSLYISIGGRRTRGAIYKIERTGAKPSPEPKSDLARVLEAPQPLDAWSRARWEPLARKLGRDAFEDAVLDETINPLSRSRAVEVLTDLFGGLRPRVAAAALGSPRAEVRARATWSLGRAPCEGMAGLLLPLLMEKEPAVLRCVLESLSERLPEAAPERVAERLGPAFDTMDRRVRQAAARLAALLPREAWEQIPMENAKPRPSARLTWTLASYWRGDPVLEPALSLLQMTRNPELQEPAVRLLELALGDMNIDKPAVEVHANYAPTLPPSSEAREKILQAVRPVFPSGDLHLDHEASRLLAMLEDDDPETVKKTASFLTKTSHPTDDVHYLIVLSRLKGAWPDGLSAKVAGAMLALDRKLEGHDQRTKLTWGPRLAELTDLFVRRTPPVAGEILNHPDFVAPGHVAIAGALDAESRGRAAALFLGALRKDATFPWSEPLIELITQLPPEDHLPALRAQWSNFGLRDAILLRLGKQPLPEDRARSLSGVESPNAQVVRLSLEALAVLGPGASPSDAVPLLRLLRQLILDPKQQALRSKVAALVTRIGIEEKSPDPSALKRAYQPVFDEFLAKNPGLRAELEGGGEDPSTLLKDVPWEKWDAARGEAIFRARGCQTCHAVQGALGPNLAGAASRFSREDLFEAIVNPSKDVAPLYRTTAFQLKDGQVHTGIIAFESADGYIVQTGATTTVRIDTADVAAIRPSLTSLMPEGLLKDLRPGDLADLYAHLRSLGR
jgi:putative membrane-bound dehydrogenase-like protein